MKHTLLILCLFLTSCYREYRQEAISINDETNKIDTTIELSGYFKPGDRWSNQDGIHTVISVRDFSYYQWYK